MPDIRLPDGSVRSYDAPLSGAEIAADIGKRLAKDALAVRIDGELKDLGTLIDNDAEVAIVAIPNFTLNHFVTGDDLAHTGVDTLQVFRRESLRTGEVVVEAVLDSGADGDLGLRIQLFHGLGHNALSAG